MLPLRCSETTHSIKCNLNANYCFFLGERISLKRIEEKEEKEERKEKNKVLELITRVMMSLGAYTTFIYGLSLSLLLYFFFFSAYMFIRKAYPIFL